MICSLGSPLSHSSPVVVFFDRGHPRFWNFYSTIPVDVVRVKSYMNWLFDSARVVIRVTINKLYFVSEWLLSDVVNMLWNGGGLGTGESDVLIVLFNCISHRSSSFSDVQLAALTFTFIERQQTHICSCSRGYGIKEQKKSQKNVVYFLSARGKSWNKNSQKFKKLQLQIRVGNYFSINFLRLTEEVEALGKNGGASSHTWQLQEKI